MAGSTKPSPVPISDRPWWFLGEVMSVLGVADYNTYNKNYRQQGLTPDYEVGRVQYFLKASVINWLKKNGTKPQAVKELFK